MDVAGFLDELLVLGGTEESLAHVEVLEARAPELEPLPDLPGPLAQRLGLLGIEGLYPHQHRALSLVGEGHNVVMSTGTASGKTLVYNLAFARAALEDEKRTALYLFPTSSGSPRSERRSTTATPRGPSAR
jgi:DEAD/DEAH box helicase domain-containing protein